MYLRRVLAAEARDRTLDGVEQRRIAPQPGRLDAPIPVELPRERAQVPYGMKLPDRALRPSTGARHRDACLEALALYGLNESPC